MKKGSEHTEETKQKISKTMEGSSNALKWTEDLTIETLKCMIDFLQTEKKRTL